MNKVALWDPHFYYSFPGFESLLLLWHEIKNEFLENWPQATDYNRMAERFYSEISPAFQVRFTTQEPTSFYEWQIYQSRLVPTREVSWHDFFNNLTWLCWPHLKSALIKRLCEDSLNKGHSSRDRTPLQNLLTQFDEFGAVICCDNLEIIELIKAFQWQKLFLQMPHLLAHCQCTIIGHGLFEKLLNPFIGITAKAIFLQVPSNYFKCSYAEQLAYIDKEIAAFLLDATFPHSPQALQPFPILGWPNWHPDNINKTFYENKHYFRNKPLQKAEVNIAHWCVAKE